MEAESSLGNQGWEGAAGWALTASPTPARESTSSGKNFSRVEVELSWSEALRYCRRHHTDLADLQSMNSARSVGSLYALTSSAHAWIGLFFDVRIQGLRWSSGSAFTAPVWSSLPVFKEGVCATLYSISIFPSLGAASCTAQKPFICYYGVSHSESHSQSKWWWWGGDSLESFTGQLTSSLIYLCRESSLQPEFLSPLSLIPETLTSEKQV